MRFVVFIDLFGTLILPATVIYLGYLIYLVASKSGQFPLIAIIMLAAIYGLQAIIFILKRRWQHVGWMIVYLFAYPIYGFALPVYSFWHMDDFAWGTTRVVVGEKGGKKIVASSQEKFDERMIPLKPWAQHAQEKHFPLGPELQDPDIAAQSVFAETYPVPASIANWQQGMKASYVPARSQVGVSSQVGVISHMSPPSQAGSRAMSQYAPSVVALPRPWTGRHDMLEMDDFNNGRVNVVQSQINVPTRLPRSGPSSRDQSRYGSESGGYAPSGLGAIGTEFLDYEAHMRRQDESLAREVVRNVLKEVDINTTTTKQVRALVESKLGWGVNAPVSADQRKKLDDMIDTELEEMI
jgi:chitin synthase